MRHRLARIAAGAIALGLILIVTVTVRATGDATTADPDAPALAAAFTHPTWAASAATVALPLLALAGSLVLTKPRRRNR